METSYDPTCPHCGGHYLAVVSALFYGAAEVTTEGVDYANAPEFNTKNEIVVCQDCAAEFPLADITR
jgi:hypothetical protein